MEIKKVVKTISGEWGAYWNKKIKTYIVSPLHDQLHFVFLLGGGYYYHKVHIFEFLFSQYSENVLLQSIKRDNNDAVMGS